MPAVMPSGNEQITENGVHTKQAQPPLQKRRKGMSLCGAPSVCPSVADRETPAVAAGTVESRTTTAIATAAPVRVGSVSV